MYGWNNRRVALPDLIAFAWSAPMRELAARVGMSDVGLKKLLRLYGVSGPPQGHWNRVHAGRPVPAPPAAPARGPGQRPYLHVDGRLADLPEADLPSSAGPFATAGPRRSRTCGIRLSFSTKAPSRNGVCASSMRCS